VVILLRVKTVDSGDEKIPGEDVLKIDLSALDNESRLGKVYCVFSEKPG